MTTRKDHPSPVGPNAQAGQATEHEGIRRGLYTPDERRRRDESAWTIVQGVLAPVQFLVFLVSLGLVVRTLVTGEGAFAADLSIVVKTLVLYTIMVTGAIWEKVVFGKYLFADAFFWEDVFSMLVIALHTAYLVMLFGDYGTVEQRLLVALAAYGTYVINAAQFLLKLRAARLQAEAEDAATAPESTPHGKAVAAA
jgi:3-vinyl bacteriochlorophyllide hydratase